MRPLECKQLRISTTCRPLSLPRVLLALLQSLQHVRTIAAPVKSWRLGELTAENQRQPDQRLKIELGPFGHHAVEYLAAMLLPRAIKTGKEVLARFLVCAFGPAAGVFRASAFLVPHARFRPRWTAKSF